MHFIIKSKRESPIHGYCIMYQAPLWLAKCTWFQVLSRPRQTLVHQEKAMFVLWPQSCISPMNSNVIYAGLFLFLSQSTGQSFSYLTLGITPGVTRQYLSRVDDGASSSIPILGGFRFGTSSMTNVYVSFFNRWYRIANKYPILCCVWQLPVYAHCMMAQKCNTRFRN